MEIVIVLYLLLIFVLVLDVIVEKMNYVVKSFYCQTKRCDKTKNNQCDECALKELNSLLEDKQ